MSAFYELARQHLPSNPILAGLAVTAYAVIAAVGLNVLQQLLFKNKNEPPVVFHYFPVIGSTVVYGIDPYKFLFDCRQKYGDVFSYVMLGRKITVALGPAGSNMIFNGKLSHVNAEDAYTHLTTPVFGTDVVYDCPNHMLMEQKKFIKVGLSTENFKKYVPLIVNEVTQYFDGQVFNSAEKAEKRDAFTVASQITICTAAMTLQGKEVREGLDHSFADYYHDLDGGFTPLNFVFPKLPLPSYKRRDVAHVKMRHFYLDIMKRRREDGSMSDPEGHDMIQALQGATYKDGRVVTDKEIAHMMIAILMAGQHTSAATLSWMILHLGEKPELQKALYDEQVATYGRADGTLAPLVYENLQTPYINACIREVLRIHPPLHSIMRKVVSDMPVTHLPDRQYIIPKGSFVLAAPGVTQIDPLVWKDPLAYLPTRWMGETNEVSKQLEQDAAGEKQDFGWGTVSTGASSPYLPFGAGRHRCVGEQFAHVQLGSILATLVREYEWTLAPENPRVPDQDYTTMIVMPKTPRNVIFKRRVAKSS